MVGICSYGAYVPLLRMKRADMVLPGGIGGPGEKSVANFDEDSLTMAVEAIINTLSSVDRKTVDGLFFASTTPPFLEKQTASIAAAATDLRSDILTVDVTDSLRAGTSALKLAADSVKAGSAKKVLVAAADCRLGYPLAPSEQNLGDGAGALLIGDTDVIASIEGTYSITSEFMDIWRNPDDKFIRTWQDRFALTVGYQPIGMAAIQGAMKKFKLAPKDLAKVIIPGPDARSLTTLGTSMGLNVMTQLQNAFFDVMGNTGTAFPIMLLIAYLEEAKPGDKILVVSYGDGVDVILLQVTDAIKKCKGRKGLTSYLQSKQMIPNYLKYLHLRHIIPEEKSRLTPIVPGMSVLWRERNSLLKLHGSKCKQCGWTEFPIRRICAKCHSKDNYEEVRLSDNKATMYSFCSDTNPIIPNATEQAMVRVVVDFEVGCRLEAEMAEGVLEELKVGMPLEMVFRKLERQGDIPAYYWKPRKPR